MSITKGSLIAAADMTPIPSGVIVMWSGASDAIPTGWVLCDGNNNTPNLVDRFIVGAGSTYSVGATGGSNTVTLTTAQMPSHTHTFTGTSHTHTASASSSSKTGISTTNYGYGLDKILCTNSNTSSYYEGTLSFGGSPIIDAATAGGTNSNTGSGLAHENRPPYYALCFIMKQ